MSEDENKEGAAVTAEGSSNGWLWFGSTQMQPLQPFQLIDPVEAALVALPQPVELCVLALPPAEQDALLKQLRQNPATRFSVLLCCQESPLSGALGNGLWQGYPPPELEHYRMRLQDEPPVAQTPSLVSQLCRYLWLLDAELMPVYDPLAHSRYSYPLLECWNTDEADLVSLLQRWLKSELLEASQLVERIRVCAYCRSGHLNYSEVCPSCHSIDLRSEVALHCFRCGTVAPQARFQRLGSLHCPNCQNDLRHIGVDYDRPIENQRCNSCQQLFAEAPVVARCQSCHQENNTESLLQLNIARYRLALRGRQLVRKGESYLQEYWALSHHQQPRQLFFQQLSWLNGLAHRHGHAHQLLGLRLPGFTALRSNLGEEPALARLDALFERVRELLRNSDRYCQIGEDQLLILLPHTPTEDLDIIVRRLKALERRQGDDALLFELFQLSLPDPQLPDDDAQEWVSSHLKPVISR